jgi:hypothetical protein
MVMVGAAEAEAIRGPPDGCPDAANASSGTRIHFENKVVH